MTIARKATFFLGIFIFTIPFLGFPSMWKAVFTVVCGLFLIGLSIKITLPKKSQRHKPQKEKTTQVFTESVPTVYQQNDIVEKVIQIEEVKPAPRKIRVTKKNNGPVV